MSTRFESRIFYFLLASTNHLSCSYHPLPPQKKSGFIKMGGPGIYLSPAFKRQKVQYMANIDISSNSVVTNRKQWCYELDKNFQWIEDASSWLPHQSVSLILRKYPIYMYVYIHLHSVALRPCNWWQATSLIGVI